MGRLRSLMLLLGVLTAACGSGESVGDPTAGVGVKEVDFQSSVNVCPAFQGSAANPTEIPPGQPAQIFALAVDPDGPDSDLEFQWSAESGTFSEPTRSLTEYRCGRPGPLQLQVVAVDRDACASSLGVNVTCLER
ncbi:MAG: hypothetical protein WDO69_28465 [Pseudomonadota bacterium]